MVVHDRRNDVGCLAFPARLVQFFLHPHVVAVVFGVGVFAILPVGTPACIGTFHDVHEAFTFARMVAVVVGGNEVAVLVESKLVGVAQTSGENFKIAAVGVTTGNGARVGVGPFFAIYGGDVGANVANVPIDAPVGAFGYTRHAVSAKPDVYGITRGQGGLFAQYAVFVLYFP